MTIVFRQDSKRNNYQLWVQEQPASCAIASIWMARSLAKQMSFAEGEWELAWRIYRQVVVGMPPAFTRAAQATPAPMCLDSRGTTGDQTTFRNMFANAGTTAGQVVQALRNDGLPAAPVRISSAAPLVDLTRLSQTTPAIILLGWYQQNASGQWERNGGHFIVAAERIGNKIVLLDPWDGVLSEIQNTYLYQGNGVFEWAI